MNTNRNAKQKYMERRKNAFALQKILFSAQIINMLMQHKNILFDTNILDINTTIDAYYSIDPKLRIDLEKILDARNTREIFYLQNRLSANKDDQSKLMAKFLDLYFITKSL